MLQKYSKLSGQIIFMNRAQLGPHIFRNNQRSRDKVRERILKTHNTCTIMRVGLPIWHTPFICCAVPILSPSKTCNTQIPGWANADCHGMIDKHEYSKQRISMYRDSSHLAVVRASVGASVERHTLEYTDSEIVKGESATVS